jgi:RES domain/HEPN/RES N-terminal domain 1
VTPVADICLECVGDEPLRKRLGEIAHALKCSYCQKRRKGVTLDELAQTVEDDLARFCCHGESVPHVSYDSDRVYYEQEGDSLEDLLSEELSIEPQVSEDLAALLIERDPAWPADGDEPFFDCQQSYQRVPLGGWEYGETWREFAERVKHHRRFFDDESRRLLERILGSPGSSNANALPVFTVGPGAEVESLYRARVAASEAEALSFLKNPRQELGSPPSAKATAGRMNPAGIPVFYGALSAHTAIAEVRPSVGDVVAVGNFKATRPLRLLHLGMLGGGFTGSIFAPDYEDRATRLAFLNGFHGLIVRPVAPTDEPLAYLPTQAVAEFVSSVLQFDGLLYGSAQLGVVPDEDESVSFNYVPMVGADRLEGHNVVLLGTASRIAEASAASTPAGNAHGPALTYVEDTAEAHRVSGISYHHAPIHVYDPDAIMPF